MLDRIFRRTACPMAEPRPRGASMRHVLPLIGFLVPTAVIGYGIVLPRSCAAGINELSIGFATTLGGATITYVMGVVAALRR